MDRTHDVFISYSEKDRPTADQVCAALETNGIRCWIAHRDILAGKDWGGAIIDAINESRVMVLVFSSNSNTSPQIMREVERAVNKEVPSSPCVSRMCRSRPWSISSARRTGWRPRCRPWKSTCRPWWRP